MAMPIVFMMCRIGTVVFTIFDKPKASSTQALAAKPHVRQSHTVRLCSKRLSCVDSVACGFVLNFGQISVNISKTVQDCDTLSMED